MRHKVEIGFSPFFFILFEGFEGFERFGRYTIDAYMNRGAVV